MARFEKWGFVSLPYFHSETNEWLKDWAKWRVQHWSVTRSCEIHWNSYFTSWHGKVVSVTQWLVTGSLPKIYNKPFLTLKISQYSKSGGTSSSSKPLAVSSNCCWQGKTLYLGRLTLLVYQACIKGRGQVPSPITSDPRQWKFVHVRSWKPVSTSISDEIGEEQL